jgi:hypothetical protein
MIHGRALKAFLQARRSKAQRKSPPGTLYCMKCREPRAPAMGMVDFVPFTATNGNLCAVCEVCETMMYRRVRTRDIGGVMPNLSILSPEGVPHISKTNDPSANCAFGKDAQR